MEEPDVKNTRISPGTPSTSNPNEDYIREGDTNSGIPNHTTCTSATAVDPVESNNSFELRSLSHTPTRNGAILPHTVKVPRSRRRGLFARATVLAEVEDPYQYSYRTKWFIVFLVAYAAAAAPLGSAIFFRTSEPLTLKALAWLTS